MGKEAFTTIITEDFVVAGMPPQMRDKIAPVAKLLVALVTRKLATHTAARAGAVHAVIRKARGTALAPEDAVRRNKINLNL